MVGEAGLGFGLEGARWAWLRVECDKMRRTGPLNLWELLALQAVVLISTLRPSATGDVGGRSIVSNAEPSVAAAADVPATEVCELTSRSGSGSKAFPSSLPGATLSCCSWGGTPIACGLARTARWAGSRTRSGTCTLALSSVGSAPSLFMSMATNESDLEPAN